MYKYINKYTGVIYKTLIEWFMDTIHDMYYCKACRTIKMFQLGRLQVHPCTW